MTGTDFEMPVVFHFTVAVDGARDDVDAAFAEVGGLETELQTEDLAEGGQNSFVHKLPRPVRHPNLVLKRGIAAQSSQLSGWCQDVLENDFAQSIRPRDVVVSLCDAGGDPVRSWAVGNAYPIKWSVDAFNATTNAIAIETMELAYSTLKRKL